VQEGTREWRPENEGEEKRRKEGYKSRSQVEAILKACGNLRGEGSSSVAPICFLMINLGTGQLLLIKKSMWLSEKKLTSRAEKSRNSRVRGGGKSLSEKNGQEGAN